VVKFIPVEVMIMVSWVMKNLARNQVFIDTISFIYSMPMEDFLTSKNHFVIRRNSQRV
jgi:hypothetical protein